jgi:hypothetical protein
VCVSFVSNVKSSGMNTIQELARENLICKRESGVRKCWRFVIIIRLECLVKAWNRTSRSSKIASKLRDR